MTKRGALLAHLIESSIIREASHGFSQPFQALSRLKLVQSKQVDRLRSDQELDRLSKLEAGQLDFMSTFNRNKDLMKRNYDHTAVIFYYG